MQFTNLLTIAFLALTAHANDPDGCDGGSCEFLGNMTGTLSLYADPSDAYCNPATQTSAYASLPLAFFASQDESICDNLITIFDLSTNRAINATVIGQCDDCTDSNIQLTIAGLEALSPDGAVSGVIGTTANWTFQVQGL